MANTQKQDLLGRALDVCLGLGDRMKHKLVALTLTVRLSLRVRLNKK